MATSKQKQNCKLNIAFCVLPYFIEDVNFLTGDCITKRSSSTKHHRQLPKKSNVVSISIEISDHRFFQVFANFSAPVTHVRCKILLQQPKCFQLPGRIFGPLRPAMTPPHPLIKNVLEDFGLRTACN